MIHQLKLRNDFIVPVLTGDKCFEIRYNDRGYQKGDIVQFTAVDSNGNALETNNLIEDKLFLITYVLSGWGLEKDYVVFGIKEIKED